MAATFTLQRTCPERYFKPEPFSTFKDANSAMLTQFNRLVENAKELEYLENTTCGESTALIRYKDGTYDKFVIKGV